MIFKDRNDIRPELEYVRQRSKQRRVRQNIKQNRQRRGREHQEPHEL